MTRRDWIIIFVLFISFWLFLAVDNYKQKRKRVNEYKNIERYIPELGDQILTMGGIYGKIEKIDGHRISVSIAENVTIEVNINSILKKV